MTEPTELLPSARSVAHTRHGQPSGAGAENLELRRMLCVAHAGAAAYMDDGEAQDNRDLPMIDFLRDSPPEIRDKLNRRALKKLAAPQPTKTVPPAGRVPEFDQFLSDVMTAAGLVTHGKQCKQLGERLGAAVMKLRVHGIKGGQHGAE